MSALVPSSPWSRLWARIKAVVITEAPQTFAAGVMDGRDWPTPPQFPAIAAEAAPSKFPYIYSCVSIVSSDLAGVPLQVQRGIGADAEIVPDHPTLALLETPNSSEDGTIFLRQLWWDYLLTGWACALKLRDAGGNVVSLIRLHPSKVEVRTDTFGFLSSIAYMTGGPPVNYAREDILFFRRPGWLPGPQGTYGVGWVQPLQDDLQSELRVVEFNKRSFSNGRPDMFATLTDPSSPPAIGASREDIEKRINDNLRKTSGGVHLLNGAYTLTPSASSTPKDMEGSQQRDWNRRSTLAVTHVPPIKVGLETANFATSVQQDRGYWEYYVSANGKGGEGAVFCGEFSRLAREMSGDATDTVSFDVSGITSLQESRTDRLARVGSHILYGMDTVDAYAYEGFADAPIENQPAAPAAVVPPTAAPTEAAPTRSLRGMFGKSITPRSTTQRDIVWRNFAATMADPLEAKLTFAMARMLAKAKARYIERLRAATGSKALSASLLDAILGTEEETAAYLAALTPTAEQAHTVS